MTRHFSPYRHARRLVHHVLGGEGHTDVWVRGIDYALIGLTTLNVLASILESVEDLAVTHGPIFHDFDICSVVIFTAEYLLRLWTAVEHEDRRFHHPVMGRLRYMMTPLAIIDLLAIVPFWLGMLVQIDLRATRALRLLRVFKLTRYSSAMTILLAVLKGEARALGAMLFILVVMVITTGSLMYVLEHHAQPHAFSDIPSSMWWAVVTLSTIGYGDMVPVTAPGRLLAAATAVIGVGMIALPAGVLASGFSEQLRLRREEYRDTVERALSDGRISRRERRHLEEMRTTLQLTHAEAAKILEHAVKGGAIHCPHCGEPVHRPPMAATPEDEA